MTHEVKLSEESYATLKKLSELSDLEQKTIVDNWLSAIQKVLDRFPSASRFTVSSHELITKKGNRTEIIGTLCNPITVTSFPVEDSVSDKKAEKKLRVRLIPQ